MNSIKYSAGSQLILKESTKDYMSPILLGHPDNQAETSFWAVLTFHRKNHYKT